MDVAFLVDSSHSVEWKSMLDIIADLVEYFYDEVSLSTGIGMITYGDTAKVVIPLNSLRGSRNDILKSIKEAKHQGGSNEDFTQAMQLVPDFFSSQQGGRVGVKKVVLMYTDKTWHKTENTFQNKYGIM